MIGVKCGMDDSYQSFATCIHAHETMSTTRNCHCPVASIKSQRDNAKLRAGAGFSASVILSCPRAYAMEQTFDLYEPVESGYHKFRGTLIHAMFEADPDPPPHVIMERRIERWVDVDGVSVRITGKPDYIDPDQRAIIDFKSKHLLPKKPDAQHEAQINIYRYLVGDGVFCDTKEPCQIDIRVLGIHYVTFHTKKGMIWLKMRYPVWENEDTLLLIQKRLRPLTAWKEHGTIPVCDPFTPAKYWKCQCEKYEEQLREGGVSLEAFDRTG